MDDGHNSVTTSCTSFKCFEMIIERTMRSIVDNLQVGVGVVNGAVVYVR